MDRGKVPEWFKGSVLKTDEVKASVGSNPTFSEYQVTLLNFCPCGGMVYTQHLKCCAIFRITVQVRSGAYVFFLLCSKKSTKKNNIGKKIFKSISKSFLP